MTAHPRPRRSRDARPAVVASGVWRPEADRPAPEAARVPPLPEPLVGAEWRGTPWPLNEEEIDLPEAPAPAPTADSPEIGPEAPEALRYIGYVRAGCVGVKAKSDMDVLVVPPDCIVFGQAQLEGEQALRLCALLLRAVQGLGSRGGSA